MNKEFIPYEQALALKELGFEEPCFGLYAPPCKTVFLHHYGLLSAKEQVLAPLYQQAFRWFRDNRKLSHEIQHGYKGFFPLIYEDNIIKPKWSGEINTYEQSESVCLKKLIEIVKSKKDE